MKFSELQRKEEIGILSFLGSEDVDLSDPQYDSRKCTAGSAFFAIQGFQTNGHRYIQSALELGATCIVLEDASAFSEEEAIAKHVVRIVVANSRKALALISEQVFGNPSSKLRLIGVTGTNGKTTTTSIIKQLLEWSGEKVGLIGTIGIKIGEIDIKATHTTPESRDISELLKKMIDQGVTTCVMEVSSHALVLERVAALDFDIAAFTNLTQDHLDFHKTMDEYFLAKQQLFNHLKDTAVAITNADSMYGEAMVNHTIANSHSYGVIKEARNVRALGHADLMALEPKLSLTGIEFILQKRYSEEHALISSKLIGAFNVENILAALSALYFGVEDFPLEKLARGIKQVEPVRGRFESITLPNGAIAVIDYAHTPDALENVLKTLNSLAAPDSRIFTVFGCGGDRDKTKRPVMGEIAVKLSHSIIITNDNPRSEKPEQIVQDILSGIPDNARDRATLILDRKVAIKTALDQTKSGDAVLIAGKGHETYQIFSDQTLHFDDREEVLEWIAAQ